MSAAEVQAWREAYVLTRAAMADLLGVDRTTVRRWETGHTPPPRWLPLALETLAGQRKQIALRLRARREYMRLQHDRARAMKVAM